MIGIVYKIPDPWRCHQYHDQLREYEFRISVCGKGHHDNPNPASELDLRDRSKQHHKKGEIQKVFP